MSNTNESTNDAKNVGDVLAELAQRFELANAAMMNTVQQMNPTNAGSATSSGASAKDTSSTLPVQSANRDNLLNVLNPVASRRPAHLLSNLLLGPVWRGLFGLFGGREQTPSLNLTPFVRPTSVTTALDSTATESGGGAPLRTDAFGFTQRIPSSAPIQVSIQALDARSFLDRSDDIAAAVRQAMLTNHPINESMTEL